MNYCTSRVDFFGLTDDGACSNGADDHCDYLMALVFVESIISLFGFDSSEACLACSFFESCVGTPPDAELTEEKLLPRLHWTGWW